MSAFAELRAVAALALAELADPGDDWPVHDGPQDAVTEPCYLIAWADPMALTITACQYRAELEIVCIGARIDPSPGYEQVEELTARGLPALQRAGFVILLVSAPAPLELGGITYLSVRIRASQSLTLEG